MFKGLIIWTKILTNPRLGSILKAIRKQCFPQNKGRDDLIDKKELKRLIDKFKTCGPMLVALGDEVRQNILLKLADSGFEGINVTNLSAKTNLSRPAISHHLKVLKDSGWVVPLKKGTQIFYQLSLDSNLGMISSLIESIRKMEAAYAKDFAERNKE